MFDGVKPANQNICMLGFYVDDVNCFFDLGFSVALVIMSKTANQMQIFTPAYLWLLMSTSNRTLMVVHLVHLADFTVNCCAEGRPILWR